MGKPTGHIEVGVKTIEINNESVVTMQLWDTPGDPQVDLSPILFDKVDAAVLVFDISDQESFEAVQLTLSKAKQTLSPNVPILLCANKCDQIDDESVTEQEILKLVRTERLCGAVKMTAISGHMVRMTMKYI